MACIPGSRPAEDLHDSSAVDECIECLELLKRIEADIAALDSARSEYWRERMASARRVVGTALTVSLLIALVAWFW